MVNVFCFLKFYLGGLLPILSHILLYNHPPANYTFFWFCFDFLNTNLYIWLFLELLFFFVMKSEMSCITSKSSVSSSFLKRIGSKVLHVTTSVFLENKVSSRQLKSLSKPCFRQSKAFNRCLESSRFPITTRSCRCACFIICVRNTSLPSSHGPALHSDTTSVYFSIYP